MGHYRSSVPWAIARTGPRIIQEYARTQQKLPRRWFTAIRRVEARKSFFILSHSEVYIRHYTRERKHFPLAGIKTDALHIQMVQSFFFINPRRA